MNLGMSASTIRMLFLSTNFNFSKKVSTKREGLRKFFFFFFSQVLPFAIPFAISNHNNKQ